MLRVSRGTLPGIPSPHVVRFTMDGEILVEGPVAAGRSVDRAARLLDTMLAGFDAPSEFRASGALRLVMARAAGTLDLPAYRTLDAFAAALERFSAPDHVQVVRDLGASWAAAVGQAEGVSPADEEASGTEPITVSDLRRARRATGLSLSEIAERTRIPISLLRELEWGYLANWPSGHYARTQLVRYARAAGLDDQVVIRAVLPEFAAVGRPLEGVPPSSAAPGDAVVTSLVAMPAARAIAPVREGQSRRPSPWLAALAIPALVAIGLVPAAWNEAIDRDPAAVDEPARGAVRAGVPEGRTAGDPTPAGNTAGLGQEDPVKATLPEREREREREGVATLPQSPAPSPLSVGRVDRRPVSLREDAAFSPTFASIGSAMFYHAEGDGGSALMRAETDGQGAVLRITRVVDDNAKNFHARPSPDGSQIAFDSDRDGERAVYVADASGRNVRRVTGQGFAAVPSWSPDGRQLAYVREEEGRPRVWNLWTVDLQTGDTRRLTSHKIGQPWGAAWFPDGMHIAYSHEDRLVVRSLDGESQQIYSSPRKGQLLRTPAVSPDGRKVIFQIRRDGAWLLDLTDGSMRKILSDPTAEEFTWSPDGRQVAYHSRQSGKWGVWIMAPR